MSSLPAAWGVAAVLLAAAMVGLVLLARTRWLQSDTLKKCVVLSVGVHLLLAVVVAALGGMRPASWGNAEEGRMTMMVVLVEEPADELSASPTAEATAEPTLTEESNVIADDQLAGADEAEPSGEAALAEVELAKADAPDALGEESPPEALTSAAADSADTGEESLVVDALEAASEADQGTEQQAAAAPQPPAAYADRFGERRQAAAAARGGSEATERAVREGLAWLSAAQSSDGRWDADRHEAGIERSIDGRDRRGAGSRSDHGVTGLALLAFLGAGNTHRAGQYAESIERGIDFLVSRQAANGSLAGDAEFFAALYCHGIATIAIAETAALTADVELRDVLERAIAYSLSMQSPATGGWRYAAGDAGDTSQLGWQVMALRSSRLAGLAAHQEAETRAWAFLDRVSSGRFGGIASYRPGERPSVAMTSEACLCRMLLGMDPDHPAASEAMELLAQSPPETSRPNAYTWYYATLASFHVGGLQWERWNAQMQSAVLQLQRKDAGKLQGSWDPDPVWGGHGGRVYSTALSVMTLEVYYRYLPMHIGGETRVARETDRSRLQ